MGVSTCSSCWARNPAAKVPADADPEYVPGNENSANVCPSHYPFVSGGTESCGCMEPYHGKVCNAARCCAAKYECYGNCGDYSALYIFLGCLGGVLVLVPLVCVAMKMYNRWKAAVATTSCDDTSASAVAEIAKNHKADP